MWPFLFKAFLCICISIPNLSYILSSSYVGPPPRVVHDARRDRKRGASFNAIVAVSMPQQGDTTVKDSGGAPPWSAKMFLAKSCG